MIIVNIIILTIVRRILALMIISMVLAMILNLKRVVLWDNDTKIFFISL